MKTNTKHGIEAKFGKGRKLNLLSYAVWVNGVCQVDHKTTAANRKAGLNIERHMRIEQAHGNLPII